MSILPKSKKAILITMKAITALMIIIILLLVALLVFRIYITAFSETETSDQIVCNSVVTDIPESNIQTDGGVPDSISDYDVKMNAEWIFKNGKTYSEDAYVENPLSNSNAVYFDVTVSGVNETVYTSPVLPSGSHIENIKFDKVLSAGIYNGVLTYHLLGSDGEREIGSVQMALKITVQS